MRNLYAEKIVVSICLTCHQEGRKDDEIDHLGWCTATWFIDHSRHPSRIVMRQREIRWEGRPKNDVTLSPHECESCSIDIAEARCPEM